MPLAFGIRVCNIVIIGWEKSLKSGAIQISEEMGGEDGNRNKANPWQYPNGPHQEKDDVKLWGVFLFGLIGATATTFAVIIFFIFNFVICNFDCSLFFPLMWSKY